MSDSLHYISNTPSVVAEVIDTELVAIQLETGCYYHANATGGSIWSCIEQGMSIEAIIDYMREAYSLDNENAKKDVRVFIDQLLHEQLIRVEGESHALEQSKNGISEKEAVYEQPTLKKHDDMKELLLLDPIHDIGEHAFPMKAV